MNDTSITSLYFIVALFFAVVVFCFVFGFLGLRREKLEVEAKTKAFYSTVGRRHDFATRLIAFLDSKGLIPETEAKALAANLAECNQKSFTAEMTLSDNIAYLLNKGQHLEVKSDKNTMKDFRKESQSIDQALINNEVALNKAIESYNKSLTVATNKLVGKILGHKALPFVACFTNDHR